MGGGVESTSDQATAKASTSPGDSTASPPFAARTIGLAPLSNKREETLTPEISSLSTPCLAEPFKRVSGPAAWYGPDLARSTDWVHNLSNAEIAEIDTAVAAVGRRGLAIADIAREDFPLPSFGQTLTRIQHEVVNGRGFVLLRGLPVHRYTREEAATAYWGIGTYFGWAVPQNAKGHVLGHVKDLGNDPSNPEQRIYTTNARQQYHTDSCDIVGLLCLKPAKSGGLSSIASSVTVHNEMLDTRPELVRVLAEPFHVDRKGEIPTGKKPFYRLAVFHYYSGYLTTIYARSFIEAAQRFKDVPRLTPEQIQAMDTLDALADDLRLRLDMMLEPGDMQFLHNHQILHSRTAFEDHSEPDRKRHLLRLWLSPANGRPLPPSFAERYGTVDVGPGRGGIRVPGVPRTVLLEAQ